MERAVTAICIMLTDDTFQDEKHALAFSMDGQLSLALSSLFRIKTWPAV